MYDMIKPNKQRGQTGQGKAPLVLNVFPCLVLSLLCCLVLKSLVLSCVVLSCLVWSGLVLSCLVLFSRVVSHFASSCAALSCPVLSCPVLSCPVLPCPVVSGFVSSCLNLFRLASPYLVSPLVFTCRVSSYPDVSRGGICCLVSFCPVCSLPEL